VSGLRYSTNSKWLMIGCGGRCMAVVNDARRDTRTHSPMPSLQSRAAPVGSRYPLMILIQTSKNRHILVDFWYAHRRPSTARSNGF
jgi:hypothetical protein